MQNSWGLFFLVFGRFLCTALDPGTTVGLMSEYCYVRCGVMIMDGSLLKQTCSLELRKIDPWTLSHPFHAASCHFPLRNSVRLIATRHRSDVETQRTGKGLWKHKWLVLQKRPEIPSFVFLLRADNCKFCLEPSLLLKCGICPVRD